MNTDNRHEVRYHIEDIKSKMVKFDFMSRVTYDDIIKFLYLLNAMEDLSEDTTEYRMQFIKFMERCIVFSAFLDDLSRFQKYSTNFKKNLFINI